MAILAKCSNCAEPFERLFKFCPNCGLSVVGDGFSDQTGVAIHDLFEIACSFASISDLDLLLKKISLTAEKLIQSEASAVMLLDDRKEFLYFKNVGGDRGDLVKTIKIPMGQGIAGWIAEHRQSLLIQDVSQDARFSASLTDNKSGFVTRSILGVPLILSGELIGVMEVLNKKTSIAQGKFTEKDQEILSGLAGFAAISIANSQLTMDHKNFFANITEILIGAVEGNSKNHSGHCLQVAQTSCAIARRLKISGREYKNIYYAALLHDIGYLGAQKQLKDKQAVLSADRLEHWHPALGAEMLQSINLLKDCAPFIRSHHEYWDGSGFPEKIQGEAIPLGARIIGFVEAIEDLRNAFKMDDGVFKSQVAQFCSRNSSKFDPQVVQAYLDELAANQEAKV